MGRHDWILTRCGRRGRGTLRGHAPPGTTMVVCIQYTTNRVQCFRYASMCIATMAEIGAPGRAMVVCCVPALVFDRPQTALSSDGGRRPCRPALPSLPCLKPEGDRAKGCGPRTSTFICLQCQTCQKKKGIRSHTTCTLPQAHEVLHLPCIPYSCTWCHGHWTEQKRPPASFACACRWLRHSCAAGFAQARRTTDYQHVQIETTLELVHGGACAPGQS